MCSKLNFVFCQKSGRSHPFLTSIYNSNFLTTEQTMQSFMENSRVAANLAGKSVVNRKPKFAKFRHFSLIAGMARRNSPSHRKLRRFRRNFRKGGSEPPATGREILPLRPTTSVPVATLPRGPRGENWIVPAISEECPNSPNLPRS
jgi:hypothetical protein